MGCTHVGRDVFEALLDAIIDNDPEEIVRLKHLIFSEDTVMEEFLSKLRNAPKNQAYLVYEETGLAI
jgi:hypothetical protein